MLLAIGLLFARYHVLTVMVWAIAVLTTYTVVQRILHVHRQLADGGPRGGRLRAAGRPCRGAASAGARRPPLGPRGAPGPDGPLWYTPLRSRQLRAALPAAAHAVTVGPVVRPRSGGETYVE